MTWDQWVSVARSWRDSGVSVVRLRRDVYDGFIFACWAYRSARRLPITPDMMRDDAVWWIYGIKVLPR